MALPELLQRLLTAPGPSGAEQAPAAVWRDAAAAFAEVGEDAVGNVLARVPGSAGRRPTRALFAHLDEIGLVVTHAADDGTLAVRAVGGGVSPQVLLGQRVELLARGGARVPGVVAARADPQRTKDGKAVEWRDLHVDVGAGGRAAALELVSVGDVGVVAVEPLELAGGRIASRALDDRVGAYVALESLRRVAEAGGAHGDVVAVATVSEEVGDYPGARAAAWSVEPDVAIAVDVTQATDVPGGDPTEQGEQRLGGGASLVRGPGIAPDVFEALRAAAEREGVPYTVEVATGRSWTDADAVAVSRAGIPVGVVSIVTRYLHTPVELVELADVEACVRVLVAFLLAGD